MSAFHPIADIKQLPSRGIHKSVLQEAHHLRSQPSAL